MGHCQASRPHPETAMADTIRRVSYFYTTISDKPGEGARLLETLRSAGVNLLAFHAFPSARKAQVDFVPSDAALFTAAAKGAKIKLSKPKTAFLIDGDDRVGALAGVMARLGSAKINVTAVRRVCRHGTVWRASLGQAGRGEQGRCGPRRHVASAAGHPRARVRRGRTSRALRRSCGR